MTSDDEKPGKKNLNPLEDLELDDEQDQVTPEDLEDIDDIDEVIEAAPLGSELDNEDVSSDDDNDFAAELSVMPAQEEDDSLSDQAGYDDDDGEEIQKSGGGMKKVLAPALVLVIAAGAAGYIMMNPTVLNRLTGGASSGQDTAPTTMASSGMQKDMPAGSENNVMQDNDGMGNALGDSLPQPSTNMNADSNLSDGMGNETEGTLSPDETIEEIMDAGQEMEDGSGLDTNDNAGGAGDGGGTDTAMSGRDSGDTDGGDIAGFENDLPQEVQVETPDLENPGDDNTDNAANTPRAPESDMDDAAMVADDTAESAEGGNMKMAQAGDAEKESDSDGAGDSADRDSLSAANNPDTKSAANTDAKSETAVKSDSGRASGDADISDNVGGKESADTENDMFEQDFQEIVSGNGTSRESKADASKTGAGQSPDSASENNSFYDSEARVPQGQIAGPRKLDPRVEPATKFVIATTDNKSGDQESMIVAANRALKLRRYDAARDMFESLYKNNARDKRILMGLAIAQQNTGRVESAIQTYEALLELEPDNADALVNMLGLVREQYPSVALRRLLDLKNRYPNNAGISAQIGVTQADLGQYAEAVRYLGAAASLQPQNPQHLFNLAIVSDRQGKTTQAIQYYEQALETDSVYAGGKALPRETIYDRLSKLRRR